MFPALRQSSLYFVIFAVIQPVSKLSMFNLRLAESTRMEWEQEGCQAFLAPFLTPIRIYVHPNLFV